MTISSKIGFGEKVTGEAVIVKEGTVSQNLNLDLAGKILIFTFSPSRELLEKARFVGAVGVCVPEIHFRDFDYFKSNGDFGMMVFQKFGSKPLDSDLAEKVGKFDGKKVELHGETHELKIT